VIYTKYIGGVFKFNVEFVNMFRLTTVLGI